MTFSADSSETVTEIVSDFYNRFPYPSDALGKGSPLGFNWRWSLDCVYAFCTGATFSNSGCSKPFQILDAGCGTGVSTDYLAYLNPGSEILAIDISLTALGIAKKRLKLSGSDILSKVHFEQQDLLKIDLGKKFDFINSVGVLHHLKDPKDGLRVLADLLKPGGIIHLFLYADAGRLEINKTQKALQMLDITYNDCDHSLARSLLYNLPASNKIRRNYEEKWEKECQSDTDFSDMYLHPNERTFNLDQLFELIDSSKLKFHGFSNPRVWDLNRFLKGELLARAKKLPQNKQLQLVETLDLDISHFELFLFKEPLRTYQWKNDDYLLDSFAKINSCLLGWPGENLYDSDMNRIEVSSDALELIDAISKNPGKSLFDLPLSWEKARIASETRDLQSKQVLLLSPF